MSAESVSRASYRGTGGIDFVEGSFVGLDTTTHLLRLFKDNLTDRFVGIVFRRVDLTGLPNGVWDQANPGGTGIVNVYNGVTVNHKAYTPKVGYLPEAGQVAYLLADGTFDSPAVPVAGSSVGVVVQPDPAHPGQWMLDTRPAVQKGFEADAV